MARAQKRKVCSKIDFDKKSPSVFPAVTGKNCDGANVRKTFVGPGREIAFPKFLLFQNPWSSIHKSLDCIFPKRTMYGVLLRTSSFKIAPPSSPSAKKEYLG
jgi:hypothetical protein